jgi:hypothetical protein
VPRQTLETFKSLLPSRVYSIAGADEDIFMCVLLKLSALLLGIFINRDMVSVNVKTDARNLTVNIVESPLCNFCFLLEEFHAN